MKVVFFCPQYFKSLVPNLFDRDQPHFKVKKRKSLADGRVLVLINLENA